MANGKWARSSAIRAASAVSRAMSDPVAPMAIPTVALAIAGASLTASPSMATFASARSSLIAATLSSGIKSPQASSSPTYFATAWATRWLSPEIMIMQRILKA